ncbi:asparaginase [Verrucomicrobiaceae bacterium R5-34]|uniref:Asparaginase n=1 Tax=Oceaniferula flava TaxID=2800421 RepID=A0AAE2SFB1_9BACT|nr:asparaginase domain-containing protein [Oceaniferula flavus]MBK1831941.1 asparaginase [Verrucomicrobiaceae bacterium R5-34]MBK1855291.1 asparaginase [Oceaniferula flavus]MBM1136597.1 asparaginase [Oceaniferula flavus]
MSLLIITVGGTIDKVYFDASSEYEVGEPTVPHVYQGALVTLDYELLPLMRKDSLEMTESDRVLIRETCEQVEQDKILITHGTDTMADTAEALAGLEGKTIVLTGAMAPARFRETDAVFNIGVATGAVQALPPGVYIAMNGQIFPAGQVRKNREERRFEAV